jgi:hypothetical protein
MILVFFVIETDGPPFQTFEKWLRRGSKIFSAKKTTRRNSDF